MSLQNYIHGERYGKEAHHLELEAMDDPFLHDAIDGYDQVNDLPIYHLKKLKKQMARRTRRHFHYLRLWGIAACVVLIIGISVIFFLYDNDNFFLREEPVYVEQRALNESAPDNDIIIKRLESISKQSNLPAKKDIPIKADLPVKKDIPVKKDLPVKKEESIIQQEERKTPEEDWSTFWDQTFEEASERTLSESEVQTIFSGYSPEETTTSDNLNQTPKPVIGDRGYNDYIEKNRKQLTDNDSEEQHGKVILMFKVNAQGRPVDISVLRSLYEAADQEAVRLLQNGPDWTAGSGSARLAIAF